MARFEPFFDQVLVELTKEPEKTKGGIIIPEQSRKKPNEGKVIEKGAEATAVNKGDIVLFSQYVGTYPEIPGYGDCVLLHQSDLLGRLKR